jgi:hypothetical protein
VGFHNFFGRQGIFFPISLYFHVFTPPSFFDLGFEKGSLKKIRLPSLKKFTSIRFPLVVDRVHEF